MLRSAESERRTVDFIKIQKTAKPKTPNFKAIKHLCVLTMTNILRKITKSIPVRVQQKVVDINDDVLRLYNREQEQAMTRPQQADTLITGNVGTQDLSDFQKQLPLERPKFSGIGVVWSTAENRSVRPCSIPLECIRQAAMNNLSMQSTELREQLLWASELHEKRTTDFICDMEIEHKFRDVVASALVTLAV